MAETFSSSIGELRRARVRAELDDFFKSPAGQIIDQIYEATRPLLQYFLGTENILNIEYIWSALLGETDDPKLRALADEIKSTLTALENHRDHLAKAEQAVADALAKKLAEEAEERKASGYPFQDVSPHPEPEVVNPGECNVMLDKGTQYYGVALDGPLKGKRVFKNIRDGLWHEHKNIVCDFGVDGCNPATCNGHLGQAKTVDTVTPYIEPIIVVPNGVPQVPPLVGEQWNMSPGPVLEIPDVIPAFAPEGIDHQLWTISTHQLWELIFEKYYVLNATMLMRRRDEIVDLFDTMINAKQSAEPVNRELFNRFKELDFDKSENASKSPVPNNWEQTARDPDRY